MHKPQKKIAIIHDWLDKKYGAEEVLEEILLLCPKADLYTLVDFLPQDQRSFLEGRKITTSFLQKIPFAKKYFRKLLPLFPIAIEQFDLANYELIISSSHAVAKGVIIHPYQTHICYVNSQMRYVWDMQERYLKKSGFIKNLLARKILHKMRIWEVCANPRVDLFICNSKYSSNRLKKTLGRESHVIYPPVDTSHFAVKNVNKQNYYFTASRIVGYKNVQLMVEAFNAMPDKILYIAGDGEDKKKLSGVANKNIIFLGRLSKDKLKSYYQNSRAFIYAAIEDFGIVMVESLASGIPVIAYERGGASEIVTKDTGILYDELSVEALKKAIKQFERDDQIYTRNNCMVRARKFSKENFRKSFSEIVE